jgi:hypothetical protein
MTGTTDITAPARLLAVEVLLADPELLGQRRAGSRPLHPARGPSDQGSGSRVNGELDPSAGTGTATQGADVSGEPDQRLRDLDARLRRVEAIIETAKRLMANNSGIIECALIELDACDPGPTAP